MSCATCFTRRSATLARISSESTAWATIFTCSVVILDARTGELKGYHRRHQRKLSRVRCKQRKGVAEEGSGDPIGGGVVPYMLDGIQYVAVAGGMKNPAVVTESGPAWLTILSLPDQSNR